MHRIGSAYVLLVATLFGTVGPIRAEAQRDPLAGPTTKPGSTPPPQKLTLDQAVGVAIRNSKGLRIAIEGVERARGRVSENRAAFLPGVNAGFNFTHLDSGSSATFPGQNGQNLTVPIVRQDQKTLSIGATLPIDISGLLRTAVQVAEFQEIGARLDVNRTRNQLVLDVKNAYYDVLRAQAFLSVAEQTLKNAQERLNTAQAYLKAGTGTRFDVLRAETEVRNAEQNRISARNRLSLAGAALNNVLGLDQNTPLQTEEAGESPGVLDFNALVGDAYRNRPEVFQAEANIRAAERGVHLAQRSALPSLGIGVNLTYTPDAGGFAPKETGYSALATVTIPLFDQGISRARTRQSRADFNTARVNKQIVLDSVALEVRQAYVGLEDAQERLKVATAAVTLAEEQYRLARVRFQTGVTQVPGTSPLVEISDAQSVLTQAQNNLVNARYDAQNALARLDRAVGRYSYDVSAQPGFPASTQIPIK